MTEQELQQYLLSKYPKENEGCEWKEFKNMKNDFNGKEKDDVILMFPPCQIWKEGTWLLALLIRHWRLLAPTPTTMTYKRQDLG